MSVCPSVTSRSSIKKAEQVELVFGTEATFDLCDTVSQAVSKFAARVADINAWRSACRLRLNAAKTQLLWLVSSQLLDKVDCHDVLVLGTRVAISDTARDLGVVMSSTVSCRYRPMSRPSVDRFGYNQPRQLRPVVRSLSVNVKCYQDARPCVHFVSSGLLQLTAVRHQRRTTSSPPVGAERCYPPGHRRPSLLVTTLHQCYCSCTGCQSINESCSRSRGSYISRSLEQLPRTLLTVAFFRTLVVAQCGLIPLTGGRCSCRERIINLVIGVSQPLVLDCGTTFHQDYGGRDCPSIFSDNL